MPRTKKTVERVTGIKELRDRLNKQFGEGSAVLGSEARQLDLQFYSTGSAALDISLRGGFPYNRFVELIGGESSCKTSLCHLASKMFLADNPKGIVVHGDFENSLDAQWMERLGCKVDDRYLFLYADSGEQAADEVDDVLADRAMPALVIVDSIMAVTPMIELESTFDSQFMGKQAMLINRLIRVANARLKAAKIGSIARCSVILVNQTRPNMSAYGNPVSSSGGEGRKFFAGQRILFASASPAEKEERGTGTYAHTTKFGKKVNYQIIKNKCRGPEETGHFVFHNRPIGNADVGMDNADACINAGLRYGVLARSGARIVCGNQVMGAGLEDAIRRLREPSGAEELSWLRQQCIEAARCEFVGEHYELQPFDPKVPSSGRGMRLKIRR